MTEACGSSVELLAGQPVACRERELGPFLRLAAAAFLEAPESQDWPAFLASQGLCPEDLALAPSVDEKMLSVHQALERRGLFRAGFRPPERLPLGRRDVELESPRMPSLHPQRSVVIRGDLAPWRPAEILARRSLAFLDVQGPIRIEGDLAASHMTFFPDSEVSAARIRGTILRVLDERRSVRHGASPGLQGWRAGKFDGAAVDPQGYLELWGPWDPSALDLPKHPNLLIFTGPQQPALLFARLLRSSLLIRACPGLTSLRLDHPVQPPAARPEAFILAPSEFRQPGLALIDCPDLADLGLSLEISGDLLLEKLPALRRLPDRLILSGSLRIRGCPGLPPLMPSLIQGWEIGGQVTVEP